MFPVLPAPDVHVHAPLPALVAAPPGSPRPTPQSPAPAAAQSSGPTRRVGLHLGLNLTLSADMAVGDYFYGGIATQLTGLAALAEPTRNYVVSLLLWGGAAIPILQRQDLRLTFDLAPMVSYFYAAPVNMVSAGLLAGLRVVHNSGFTFSVKLPLVGYAGAPDAHRGSVMYYYTGAILTVPVLTVGYTF